MELIFAIVGAVLLHLISSEAYEHAPRLARLLLRLAVKRMPESLRDRYREEWFAHLEDCPGHLSKIMHAVNCLLCARVLGTVGVPASETKVPAAVVLDASTAHFIMMGIADVIEKRSPAEATSWREQAKKIADNREIGAPDLEQVAAFLRVAREITGMGPSGNANLTDIKRQKD